MKSKITFLSAIILFGTCVSQNFTKIAIDDSFGYAPRFKVVDLNNDGHFDVVSRTLKDPSCQLACWFGDGQGNFGNRVIIEDNINYSPPMGYGVGTGDYNNDGFLDIVTTNTYEENGSYYPQLVVYFNNQNETFTSPELIEVKGNSQWAIETMDVNNDGSDDFITAYYDPSVPWPTNYHMFYYPSNGNGTFGTRQYISPAHPSEISIGKMDNDNFDDVVHNPSAIAQILINNGIGNFNSPIFAPSPPSYQRFSVKIGDFNNDGFNDIISVGYRQDNNIIIINYGNGDGTVQDYTSAGNTSYQHLNRCDIGDLDNDGDLDLVATTFYANTVLFFENIGNGIFTTEEIIDSDSPNSRDIFICDLDEDGKKDVLITNSEGVFWYKNDMVLGINEDAKSKISVFPNPTSDSFKIYSSSTISRIEIYNSLGQLIFMKNSLPDDNSFFLNESGVYILKIFTEYETLIKKIIRK